MVPGPNGEISSERPLKNPSGQPSSAMKSEEYSSRTIELAGWPVTVETYRLDRVYHCTIASADPGARITRADGATKQEAEERAIERATRYLAQTRRFPTP